MWSNILLRFAPQHSVELLYCRSFDETDSLKKQVQMYSHVGLHYNNTEPFFRDEL